MSQCNPCTAMKPINRCTAELTIGTIATPSTDVFVYIKNHTTNILRRFEARSSLVSAVVVENISEYPQIEGHDYELWMTLATATNIDDRIEFTIDAVAYTCVSISFMTVYDDLGVLASGENQTLEAE